MKPPFFALYVPSPRSDDQRGFRVQRVKVVEVYAATGQAKIVLQDGFGKLETFAPIACLATKLDRANALVSDRIAALLAVEEPLKTALAGTAGGAQKP
jgi:hypothetical protein